MNGAGFRMIILLYRKSSIKPPEGSLFISDTFEGGGGLDGDGGSFEREWLSSLAKTVVSVLRP